MFCFFSSRRGDLALFLGLNLAAPTNRYAVLAGGSTGRGSAPPRLRRRQLWTGMRRRRPWARLTGACAYWTTAGVADAGAVKCRMIDVRHGTVGQISLWRYDRFANSLTFCTGFTLDMPGNSDHWFSAGSITVNAGVTAVANAKAQRRQAASR